MCTPPTSFPHSTSLLFPHPFIRLLLRFSFYSSMPVIPQCCCFAQALSFCLCFYLNCFPCFVTFFCSSFTLHFFAFCCPVFLKLCSPLCISFWLSNVLLPPSGIYKVCTGRKTEVLHQSIFTKRLWTMNVNTTVFLLLQSLIQGSDLKKTFIKQNRGFSCTFANFKVAFKNDKEVIT